MSKRDDEPSDMDAGMTTAERRRRRRRGGGLRVPSDNVPRTSRAATAPPVVAPVPEDPALAMSIAYSFSNDGSQPIARVDLEPGGAKQPAAPDGDTGGATVIAPPINGDGESVLDGSDVMDGDESTQFAPPIAPEGSPTVIDPPAQAPEAQEFEMKTREMSAVDLEALGLAELAPRSSGASGSMALAAIRAGTAMAAPPPPPAITPGAAAADPDVQVRFKQPTVQTAKQTAQALAAAPKPPELAAAAAPPAAKTVAPAAETLDTPTSMAAQPDPDGGTTLDTLTPDPDAPAPADGDYVRPRRERIKTVALNEDDLEEVREVVRAMSQSSQVPVAPRQPRAATQPPMTLPTGVPVGHGASSSMVSPIPDGIGTSATSQSIEIQVLRDQIADAAPAPAPTAPPGKASDEILSVPDIDIQMLSEQSGANASVSEALDSVDSIEVDVDDAAPAVTVSSIPPAIARANTAPVIGDRARAPSVPPPFTAGGSPPAPAKDTTAPVAKVDGGTTPPPTPVAHKAPPAPPPAAAKTKPAPSTPPPPAKPDKSRGKPWFVDLFDEDYLRTLPFLTPQATQAEAEFVIDAMGLQPGAQVLDLGCGYGRHAMELAARGFHMVGLDISTPLLVRGGEEAHRRGLTINFVRGDMRELDFDSQFDGAYCLFSTFGYFDDETNKKTVSNIARALKPGGRVMIEILNRDYVIADLPTRIWWEGEGCVVLEEVELNYFSSRIQVNRSVVFDDGRQLEQEISVRAYSLHEVGKLMHAAGFRVLEVSGGYQTRGRFFGNQSRHIIVLAERKDTA